MSNAAQPKRKLSATNWDWTRPFTLAEMFKHFGLGDVHDSGRTKPVVEELLRKGYTKKFVKREGHRDWRYAKWPSGKLVIPRIP